MYLGRFNHHPEPAIDFCIEVEEIEAMAINRRIGFDPEPTLDKRIERALGFRVGGDPIAVRAKQTLHEIIQKVETTL